MINNESLAYEELARKILDFTQERKFDRAFCKCEIFENMVSSKCWLEEGLKVIRKSVGWSSDEISAADAAFYLRDHLLNLTGDRIWGLTFTLYPDGKFEIEYDYNKPDDYDESDEESDEDITLEAAIQSLNDLLNPKS